MAQIPSDAIAARRELATAVGVFLVSFIGITGGVIYFHVHSAFYESMWGWFSLVRSLLLFPIMGPLLLTSAAIYIVNRWDYWRGLYHCPLCGRTSQRNVPCPCQPETLRPAAPKWGARWIRFCKYAGPVLLVDLGIVPIAIVFVRLSKHPRPYSFLKDLTIAHAVLCALLLAIVMLGIDLFKLFYRKNRSSKSDRFTPYLMVFALWPMIFAFSMAIITARNQSDHKPATPSTLPPPAAAARSAAR